MERQLSITLEKNLVPKRLVYMENHSVGSLLLTLPEPNNWTSYVLTEHFLVFQMLAISLLENI